MQRVYRHTYNSWASMHARCRKHEHYLKRGITVCTRWARFKHFLEDMGERPNGTSLDRYPNNKGNYEPGNCRWADKYEQANNRNPHSDRMMLAGHVYGMLSVVQLGHTVVNGGAAIDYWNCTCLCGKCSVATTRQLRQGQRASCGCVPHHKAKFHGKRNAAREFDQMREAIRLVPRMSSKR